MTVVEPTGPGPVGRIEQLTETGVRPDPTPVGQVKGRVAALEEALADLESRTAATFNRTDEEIGQLLQAVTALGILNSALIEAVRTLTSDPNNPSSAAAKATEILEEVTSEPEPQPTGDGVVREPEGDPS
jgi:hypothetical protein